MIEGESGKEIKQKHDNHTDEEIEIDLMEIFRKIIEMCIRDRWQRGGNDCKTRYARCADGLSGKREKG